MENNQSSTPLLKEFVVNNIGFFVYSYMYSTNRKTSSLKEVTMALNNIYDLNLTRKEVKNYLYNYLDNINISVSCNNTNGVENYQR